MKHKDQIIKLVEANTFFSYDDDNGDNDDYDELLFRTRENGCVGTETASDIDIQSGYALKKILLSQFHDIDVSIEVVDEWVHINVIPKVVKVDEFRYIFKKDINGQGFSSSFPTLDDLIKEYGHWVEVDWKQIETKLSEINDYPNPTFVGWNNANQLLIKKAGEIGNKWGYNFFIIKSKKL